ncbi:MAG: ABC transporter substrate-binding protein [Clostridia bacterium]|nr:ABC transporter substrate-binding protein [Clostridia bacterium]
MKNRILAMLLALALVVLCVPAMAEETVTYTVALDGEIVAMDPAFSYDFTTNLVTNQICESVLTYDENDQLVPMLASSWEQVDDVTYVYTIRDDVNFSDGTPMTVDDVVFSVARHLDPDLGSYLSGLLYAVESIEATGEWEMTIKLAEPNASFMYVLGTAAGYVISKANTEAQGDLFGTPEGTIVGTGPFVLDSWRSGQDITLVPNENYWDASFEPAVDEIVFQIIPEDITRITALTSGEADLATVLPTDLVPMLEASPNVDVEYVDSMGVLYLSFNCAMPPFDEVAVRQAIYCAIDFAEIQETIIMDAGMPASILPNSEALYGPAAEEWVAYAETVPTYDYDVERAQELLATSSVPDGFSMTLVTNEDSTRYNVCLAIQEDLKAIGIDCEIVKVSSEEHTNYQYGGVVDADGYREYGMLIGGWGADWADVSANLEPLYAGRNACAGGTNAALYDNEEVNALIDAQAAVTDPSERNALIFQALDIIGEEVPYIIVTYPIRPVATSTSFTKPLTTPSWVWNMRFNDVAPVA